MTELVVAALGALGALNLLVLRYVVRIEHRLTALETADELRAQLGRGRS